jgi:hypothetical protein
VDPGSGNLFDPGWRKFGSGINIPDPQHWNPVFPSAFSTLSESAIFFELGNLVLVLELSKVCAINAKS